MREKHKPRGTVPAPRWGEQTPPSTASVPLNLSCLSMALQQRGAVLCAMVPVGSALSSGHSVGAAPTERGSSPRRDGGRAAGLVTLSQGAGPAGGTRTLPSVFLLVTVSHLSPLWHAAMAGSPWNLHCQCSAAGRTGCEERAWKGGCPMQGSTLLGIGSGGEREKRLVPLVLGGKSFLKNH